MCTWGLMAHEFFTNHRYLIVPYIFKGNLLIIIIIGISTVGGLGGGIEKVPILMVLLNYSQK